MDYDLRDPVLEMATAKQHQRLAIDGIKLGLKLASILSILYLCFLIAVFNLGPRQGGTSYFLATVLVIVPYGIILGTLPSMVIGMVTGWSIAYVIKRFSTKFSRKTAFLLGLLVGVGVALVVNSPLLPKSTYDTGMYLVSWGIPSLIYILASGYMGIRLYSKAMRE